MPLALSVLLCVLTGSFIAGIVYIYSSRLKSAQRPDSTKKPVLSIIRKCLMKSIDYIIPVCTMAFLAYVGCIMPEKPKQPKDENGFTAAQRKLLGIPEMKPPKIKLNLQKSSPTGGILTAEELKILGESEKTDK